MALYKFYYYSSSYSYTKHDNTNGAIRNNKTHKHTEKTQKE